MLKDQLVPGPGSRLLVLALQHELVEEDEDDSTRGPAGGEEGAAGAAAALKELAQAPDRDRSGKHLPPLMFWSIPPTACNGAAISSCE